MAMVASNRAASLSGVSNSANDEPELAVLGASDDGPAFSLASLRFDMFPT